MCRRRIAWCVAMVALSSATEAAAQPRERVRVQYSAPAECPAQGALESAVLARTAAAQLATTTADRQFSVTIASSDDGYVGSLSVDDGGAARELAATRCDDLVSALSLVIALAIDPPRVEVPAPRRPAYHVEIVASGGATGGVTPGAAIAASAAARVGRHGLGHLGLAGMIGADRTDGPDGGDGSNGSAELLWLTGRADVCWQWLDQGVAGDLCGHVELGSLRASGRDVARAQETTRLWLAPGAHASLRWPATTRWFAELSLGASVPLLRDRFYFDPGTVVHSTWWVTPWVLFGGGVRFGRSE